MEEIIPFLLREKGNMRDQGRKIDVGPNYYAGRLLSSGYHTYYKNWTNDPQHRWFKVEQGDAMATVDKANSVLDSFAMVAIYEWPRAMQCVTNLMLQEFDKALRIERIVDGMRGGSAATVFAELIVGEKYNLGQYRTITNASSVWKGLSYDQKKEFREHEWIDLQIYEHGVQVIIEQVHSTGCDGELEEDLKAMELGNEGAGDGDFDGLLSMVVRRYRQAAKK